MDVRKIVEYGLFRSSVINVFHGVPNTITKINRHEIFTSTNKSVVLIEDSIIKDNFPYQFIASTVISSTSLVIGLTKHSCFFTVFNVHDPIHPIATKIPCSHTGVYHMIFSPKSKTLLTIGSGIISWSVQTSNITSRSQLISPNVSITKRSEFAQNFETQILNYPCFDYDNEWIFLPSPAGITPYDLDGNQLPPMSWIPSSLGTTYVYNNYASKLITYDSNAGMCLWSKKGKRLCRFAVFNSPVFAFFVIDVENILCFTSLSSIFILNIKTGRAFRVYSLDRMPTRIQQISQNEFACIDGNRIEILSPKIVWYTFALHLRNTIYIRRCPLTGSAARLLFFTKSNFIKLYSPKTHKLINVATTRQATTLRSLFYDRGVFFDAVFDPKTQTYSETLINQGNRVDEIFMVMDDGTLLGYDTGVQPCKECLMKQIDASFFTKVFYRQNWCYLTVSNSGEINILDQITFQRINRFGFHPGQLIGVEYHYHSNSLILLFNEQYSVFDLNRGVITSEFRYPGSKVARLYGDTLYLGYESGKIAIFELIHDQFVPKIDTKLQKPHEDAVTGFAFASSYWMSCSLDQRVIVWDYNYLTLSVIKLPLPLYSIEISNGFRDIIVATDSEAMVIRGSEIFGEIIDSENAAFDNYNKKDDHLFSEIIDPHNNEDMFFMKGYGEEEEEEKEENVIQIPKHSVKLTEKQIKYREAMKKRLEEKKSLPPLLPRNAQEQRKEQIKCMMIEEMIKEEDVKQPLSDAHDEEGEQNEEEQTEEDQAEEEQTEEEQKIAKKKKPKRNSSNFIEQQFARETKLKRKQKDETKQKRRSNKASSNCQEDSFLDKKTYHVKHEARKENEQPNSKACKEKTNRNQAVGRAENDKPCIESDRFNDEDNWSATEKDLLISEKDGSPQASSNDEIECSSSTKMNDEREESVQTNLNDDQICLDEQGKSSSKDDKPASNDDSENVTLIIDLPTPKPVAVSEPKVKKKRSNPRTKGSSFQRITSPRSSKSDTPIRSKRRSSVGSVFFDRRAEKANISDGLTFDSERTEIKDLRRTSSKPIIRYKKATVKMLNYKRAKSVEPRGPDKEIFKLPPPNVIIDINYINEKYGRIDEILDFTSKQASVGIVNCMSSSGPTIRNYQPEKAHRVIQQPIAQHRYTPAVNRSYDGSQIVRAASEKIPLAGSTFCDQLETAVMLKIPTFKSSQKVTIHTKSGKGKIMVKRWRRSVPPPQMKPDQSFEQSAFIRGKTGILPWY